MGFFSFRQQAVAANWRGRCISFLGALLVQVTAPAPQAVGRLLAFFPDVAELLAVVALGKSILALYASTLIAMWQWLVSRKIPWDFAVLGKFIGRRVRFMIFDPSGGDRRVAVIFLTLIKSKPRLTSPSGVFCSCVVWQVAYHCHHRFSGFGTERVIGHVIGVEV
jgi:hypothetical protein